MAPATWWAFNVTAMHDHHQGLAHDLRTLAGLALQRRHALRWLAGAGLVGAGGMALLSYGGGDDAGGTTTGTSDGSGPGSTSGRCSAIPEETAGPFPGDGSNGVNALALSGIVRSDIRSSFAGASGVAEGIPLTVTLTLADSSTTGCDLLTGYAVYLWHCDREGRYSMYSRGVTDQNYLRGVQASDSKGTLSFQTIFPGCYDGRMPHIHFEIYAGSAAATGYTHKLRTSQLALPRDVCESVYTGASGYAPSLANLADIGFDSDNVFSDGVELQLASVSGSLAAGYVATLQVAISA